MATVVLPRSALEGGGRGRGGDSWLLSCPWACAATLECRLAVKALRSAPALSSPSLHQPAFSPGPPPPPPRGSDSQWRAGPACDPGPPTALLINLAGFSSVILVHSFTNIHSANLGPALCRALGLHDKACAAVERAFIKCLLCAESCAGADTGTQQRWRHTWFLPLQRWQSSGGDTCSSLRALQCRALRNA